MAVNQTAFGFVGLEQVFNQRVTEYGAQLVWDAVQKSAEYWNTMVTALMSDMVVVTTDRLFRHYLGDEGEMEPLGQFDHPAPALVEGYYDVELAIQRSGTAWGANREANAKMTVGEVNRHTLAMFKKDAKWIRRHIWAALFTNTNQVYHDDDTNIGDLSIKPLANADGVLYNLRGGTTVDDTHHIAQANAIDDDNNAIQTIRTELVEHPTNEGEVVVYASTALADTIEDLSNFVPVGDPELDYGDSVTTVKSAKLAAVKGFGDEVRGRTDKCWIVEWMALPAAIMFAKILGRPVLGMREHPEAELRGLQVNTYDDKGLMTVEAIRRAGFGVIDRIGAVVMEIGDGTYTIPTNYTAPLDV